MTEFINKQKTLICLILDRSGSMGGLESAVIDGVNKFIAEQKELPQPALFAAVRFDSNGSGHAQIERFRDITDLKTVVPLQKYEFQPRGGTPLLDAIGTTIHKLDHDLYTYGADRVIVVIYTDGQENSSKEFTRDSIKKMIESRQASDKWSFLFLGANLDAAAEAGSLGINASNWAGYTNSEKGLHTAYTATSAAVSFMRSSGSNQAQNLSVGNLGEVEKDATVKTGS